MAGAHLSDLRYAVSTEVESAFGTATADADFDKLFRITDDDVDESITTEDANVCGNEFPTGQEILREDASVNFNMPLYPDSGAWAVHKLTGGGAGYSISGSTPNYLHTFKRLAFGTYAPVSSSLFRWDEGAANYRKFKGGIMESGEIAGSVEGDSRVRYTGRMSFDGSVTTATPSPIPTCDDTAKPYRMSGATITVAPYGGSALTGLKNRSFSVSWDNQPETDEEVSRTGNFVSARERGDRIVRATYGVFLDQSDTLAGYLRANQAVSFTVALANYAASRVFTAYVPKAVIKSITYSRATRPRKRVGLITMQGVLDATDATTIANSPAYFTVQTGTADYEA
jgi:hypothetical protein